MCQEVLLKLSELVKASIQSTQDSWISIYQKNINDKKGEIKDMQDTLSMLRATYGVFNVETQSETYTQLIAENESNLLKAEGRLKKLKNVGVNVSADTLAILEAEIAGLNAEKIALTSINSNSSINIHKFNKGLSLISILNDRIKKEENQFSYDQIKLSQIKQAHTSQPEPIHLVESAEVPLIKSRPKRSILVFTSTLLGFLLASFSVLLVHSIKSSSLFKPS
jgi:capsule polysaccharide export protein KpsE/RkpR